MFNLIMRFSLLGIIDIITACLLLMIYLDNLFVVLILISLFLRGLTSIHPFLPVLMPIYYYFCCLNLIVAILILVSYWFSNLATTLLFFYYLIKGGYSIFAYFFIR